MQGPLHVYHTTETEKKIKRRWYYPTHCHVNVVQSIVTFFFHFYLCDIRSRPYRSLWTFKISFTFAFLLLLIFLWKMFAAFPQSCENKSTINHSTQFRLWFRLFLSIISTVYHLLSGSRAARLLVNWLIDDPYGGEVRSLFVYEISIR